MDIETFVSTVKSDAANFQLANDDNSVDQDYESWMTQFAEYAVEGFFDDDDDEDDDLDFEDDDDDDFDDDDDEDDDEEDLDFEDDDDEEDDY